METESLDKLDDIIVGLVDGRSSIHIKCRRRGLNITHNKVVQYNISNRCEWIVATILHLLNK